MANLDVQPDWLPVRQLENSELARGGINGNMNDQAKALAARTLFLRNKVDVVASIKTNRFNKLRNECAVGRAYIWKNPKYSGDSAYRFSVGVNMNGWNTAEWDFIADIDNFYRIRYGFTGAIRSPGTTADAINIIGTISGSANNKYFTQIDSSLEINFYGIGLLINQYVDPRGGIFDVYVDGIKVRPISANSNNPENINAISSNIQKLVASNLTLGNHVVKLVFKGDDPLFPPSSSPSRGWFKEFTGADTHSAAVISGSEMGISATGTSLIANGILEFAISMKPTALDADIDWVPAHNSASGCIVINNRKIFLNENILDDNLSSISSEVEIKEFTMIQDYTAYNSHDLSKIYPMWSGRLITKFDRLEGLTYNHEFITLNELLSGDGYTAMSSGRRTSDLLKYETDNGFSLDISSASPVLQITHYPGVIQSAVWRGNKNALALKVENAEASGAIGTNTADGNTTVLTERPDGFVKTYFKPIASNKTIPKGTTFTSKHCIWLARL